MPSLPAFIHVYPETAIAHVACPRCGAAKGERCKSSTVPSTHHERMDAAEVEVARTIAGQTA